MNIECEPTINISGMRVDMGGGSSESNAEAWAVGERHGVPVDENDQTYHNNSKYWSQQAAAGLIDDTAGEGDTNKTWSADKLVSEIGNGGVVVPTFTKRNGTWSCNMSFSDVFDAAESKKCVGCKWYIDTGYGFAEGFLPMSNYDVEMSYVEFVDTMILDDGETIRCHRIIFSSSSGIDEGYLHIDIGSIVGITSYNSLSFPVTEGTFCWYENKVYKANCDIENWESFELSHWDSSSLNEVISSGLSGKADKVSGATSGNFAALDSNGNLTDSGHKHSDYLTSHQDISGKLDKPSTAGTSGQVLTSNGSGGQSWQTPTAPTSIIDDTAGAGDTDVTFSADKLATDHSSLMNAINEITESVGSSRNIFNDSVLKNATGITLADGVFSGTANYFSNAGNIMSGVFDEGTQYTFSAYVKTSGSSSTTGDGICLRIVYSDSSQTNAYAANSTSEYTRIYATSTNGKNVSDIKISYASSGSNVWDVKQIQVEAGTTPTDYVSPTSDTLTAVDTIARDLATAKYTKPVSGIPATDLADTYIEEPASDGTSGQVLTTDGNGGRSWTTVQGGGATIDDNAGEGDTGKCWSANKLSAITETVGVSRNIFDDTELKAGSGITYNNGVFTGTASKFSNVGNMMSGKFETNKQYAFSVYAYTDGESGTTGDGLTVRFIHTDNTQKNAYFANSTATFTRVTVVSSEGKTVSAIKLSYASSSANVWHIKMIQVEAGTEATDYVSPTSGGTLTAIDSVARESVGKIVIPKWYDRFGSDYLRIAYSAIWVDEPNTATHWLFACDMGFNALKGDVEITSDGKLIMCHDAGFTFDGNGRITEFDSNNCTLIKNMTYAECKEKFYAHLPSRYGGYCPVADIDDFIGICKDKGKICFVTVRTTNTADVVDALADKIIAYKMEKRTIINAIASNILEVVRSNPKCDDIAINFVAPSQTAITTANVDTAVSLGKCFLNIWNSSDSTTVIDNSATAIAYAKTKDVPLLGLTHYEEMWNYLISKGIYGAQCYRPIFDVEPKNYRFKITISDGSASFGNLFASDRFTGTVSLSGTTLTVSDICPTGSPLTNVIDGIQPIKMNMLNPVIRAVDQNGNTIPCVWSNNAFVLTLGNADDNIYTVIVDV